MKEHVELFGNQYEVVIERLPGKRVCRVSGSVVGERLQVEWSGHNAALARWRAAAQRKLKAEKVSK
jgi:hypothetical protein